MRRRRPFDLNEKQYSVRKQPMFCNATTGSPQNDVWGRNSIPMTSYYLQIWIVLVIASTNQKHYTDLGSDTSPVWNFWASFLDVVGLKTSCGVATCRMFS